MDKIMTFTSASGFVYSYEPDAMDNLELFEYIRTANDPGESSVVQLDAAIKAFICIIGEDQNKELRAFLKERDGKIKTSAYRKEIAEVMNHLGNAKKK